MAVTEGQQAWGAVGMWSNASWLNSKLSLQECNGFVIWQHGQGAATEPSAGGLCRMFAASLQEGNTPGDLAAQAGHYETAQLLGERRRLVALAEGRRAQGTVRSVGAGAGAGAPSAPPWQAPPGRSSSSAALPQHGSASSSQAAPSSSEAAGSHLRSSGRVPLLAEPSGSAVGQSNHPSRAPLYPQVFSLAHQLCCCVVIHVQAHNYLEIIPPVSWPAPITLLCCYAHVQADCGDQSCNFWSLQVANTLLS